jgi:hypothetical protein
VKKRPEPIAGEPMSLSPAAAALRRRYRAVALGLSEPAAEPETPQAVSGTILDASPHLLVLNAHEPGPEGCRQSEVRLAMTETTAVWHGGRAGTPALRPGREVIVRPAADAPGIDRIWVEIARVTGVIVSSGPNTVEIDAGPHRGRTQVGIPPHALGRVLVRHPNLEPGHLMDVICVRSPDGPLAVRPGTAQPGTLTAPPRVPATHRGTATWFGGVGCPTHETTDRSHEPGLGAAYPAVDPEGYAGGCTNAPTSCAPLPYLSLGSELTVRNECTDRELQLPVVECGCIAARFCDRCVECGTSPRGRVVELTPTAFTDLGGDLATGCFNASLTFPPAPTPPEAHP